MKDDAHILVVRPDRLGDLVLAFPVVMALRRRFPRARLSMLARSGTAPVAQSHPEVARVLTVDAPEDGRRKAPGQLARELRSAALDAAIVLYPRWWLAWALWRTGIPVRIGPRHRLYTPLFTHRVAVRRHEARVHEVDLNLRFLAPLGVVPPPATTGPALFGWTVPAAAEARIQEWAQVRGLRLDEEFVILHPGSGGSAADWPAAHFAALTARLAGTPVVVTGGPAEEALIRTVAGRRPDVLCGIPCLSLLELAALMARAAVVVANSTGPLHLAVALGTPVVGLYPPDVVCGPDRWGPYGHRESVLIPLQPPRAACRRERCRHCTCMAQIDVEGVLERVRSALQARVRSG